MATDLASMKSTIAHTRLRRQTGPDVTRLAVAAVAAAPIGPVPLDRVNVPDDPIYGAKIKSQINIPENIKDGLKAFYTP